MNIKKPKPVRLSISVTPELNDQIMELTKYLNMSKAKIVGEILEESVPEVLDLFEHMKDKEEPISSGLAWTVRKFANFLETETKDKN